MNPQDSTTTTDFINLDTDLNLEDMSVLSVDDAVNLPELGASHSSWLCCSSSSSSSCC